MFSLLLDGLQTTFSPGIFPFLLLGVTGGIVIGALPGLTATMGVAVLLPLTFGMESTRALVMLAGVYIGAIYGGSIAAILLKTPGTRLRRPRFSTAMSSPERERRQRPCPSPPSPPSPAAW